LCCGEADTQATGPVFLSWQKTALGATRIIAMGRRDPAMIVWRSQEISNNAKIIDLFSCIALFEGVY
jgi:hypothetical protein